MALLNFCTKTLLETVSLLSIVGIGGPSLKSNIRKILAGIVVYILLPELKKQKKGNFAKLINLLKYFPIITVVFKAFKKSATQYITENLGIACVIVYRENKQIGMFGKVHDTDVYAKDQNVNVNIQKNLEDIRAYFSQMLLPTQCPNFLEQKPGRAPIICYASG